MQRESTTKIDDQGSNRTKHTHHCIGVAGYHNMKPIWDKEDKEVGAVDGKPTFREIMGAHARTSAYPICLATCQLRYKRATARLLTSVFGANAEDLDAKKLLLPPSENTCHQNG